MKRATLSLGLLVLVSTLVGCAVSIGSRNQAPPPPPIPVYVTNVVTVTAPAPVPAVASPTGPRTNAAIVPVSRTGSATNRQSVVLQRAKDNPGDCDIAFIGDSITQGWEVGSPGTELEFAL